MLITPTIIYFTLTPIVAIIFISLTQTVIKVLFSNFTLHSNGILNLNPLKLVSLNSGHWASISPFPYAYVSLILLEILRVRTCVDGPRHRHPSFISFHPFLSIKLQPLYTGVPYRIYYACAYAVCLYSGILQLTRPDPRFLGLSLDRFTLFPCQIPPKNRISISIHD